MKERRRRARRARSRTACGCPPSTRRARASCAARRRCSAYRSSFSIYDQADAVRLTDYVRRDLNLDPKRFPPRRLHARDLGAEERARRARSRPATVRSRRPSTASPRCTASTSAGCSTRRRSTSTTCSCSTVRLFREHPDVLAALARPLPPRARRRVPGHQRRPVGARAHAHRRAPQRHGRGRHGSVPDRGHADHDGRRITPPDRAGPRRRRRALLLRKRRLPPRPSHAPCTDRLAPIGIAITTRSGRSIVSTADHVHFAGSTRSHLSSVDGSRCRLLLDCRGMSTNCCLDRRVGAQRHGDGRRARTTRSP